MLREEPVSVEPDQLREYARKLAHELHAGPHQVPRIVQAFETLCRAAAQATVRKAVFIAKSWYAEDLACELASIPLPGRAPERPKGGLEVGAEVQWMTRGRGACMREGVIVSMVPAGVHPADWVRENDIEGDARRLKHYAVRDHESPLVLSDGALYFPNMAHGRLEVIS